MKLFALNYSCQRDADLRDLMIETLVQHGIPFITQIRSVFTEDEYPSYGNGSGWEASIMKLNGIRWLLDKYVIDDTDYIMSVDSDVVFTSPEIFTFIDGQYGIIGTQHKQPFRTAFGPWGHMSGALMFIRGDVARAMCSLPEKELRMIRQDHFKAYEITENEDVVLSYLARYVGASEFDLPGNLSSGNFEFDVTHDALKSFYHLNYCPTEFMGEKVEGKWRIPSVLKLKGIEL